MSADFRVIAARWERDQAALRHVREQVFVLGQHVPVELEWDGLDQQCDHVLALDAENQAIGTARLSADSHIQRMAVLAPWRGKGVGAALLEALLDKAHQHGHAQVVLHAQTTAIGFYQRFGFQAEGDEFIEAGIRHRYMRRSLHAPGTQTATFECRTHTETIQAVLRLLTRTRHQVCICSPDLLPVVLDNEPVVTALRAIAESGRHASIRCLLHDADKLLREGHRVLALAQRLPSIIELRIPLEHDDLAFTGAFVLDDDAGVVYRACADQPVTIEARHDSARHRKLSRWFETVWERAVPATQLRALSL